MWLEQHAGAVAGSHGEGTAGPQGALGASAVPVNKGETSDGSFVGTGEGQWGQLHALKSPPPQPKGGQAGPGVGVAEAEDRQGLQGVCRDSLSPGVTRRCGLPGAYRKNQVAGFAEASVGAREGEESENSLRSQLVQQGRHRRVAVGGQAQRGLRVF